MNYKEQQAMVERLKTTWTAFGGLSKEEQKILLDNHNEVMECSFSADWRPFATTFWNGNVYRLNLDFQLPAPAIEPPEGYRIVSIEDRKRCKYPEYCVVKWLELATDPWMNSTDDACWNGKDLGSAVFAVPTYYVFAEDRVKASRKFVEYPIKQDGAYHICKVRHLGLGYSTVRIHELPSIVGFAGVKFEGQKSSEWCMFTTAFLTDKGTPCAWTLSDDGTEVANLPATPIAARFYINGEMK